METDPYVCFLSRPQETSQYGNINQINCRGIPARAPLLIKPSAEDRTLIKKPCRTVVPLNRGTGRAIAFFFFPSVVRLYLTALKAKTHECWTLRRRQSDILTVRSAVIKHRGRPGKSNRATVNLKSQAGAKEAQKCHISYCMNINMKFNMLNCFNPEHFVTTCRGGSTGFKKKSN